MHWFLTRSLAVVLASSIAACVVALYMEWLVVPDRFNPWAALDVMAPPNFLTGQKLSRARSNPARCLEALAQTGMQYDVLPDRVTGPGCGFAPRPRSAREQL